ncbi:hypothetical protein JCM5296_005395 [Sporobolomyces johnsonii]
MQLLDLPTELLVHIVRLSVADLDLGVRARSKALCSYSYVCSALHGVAREELARDVWLYKPSQLPSFLAFAHATPVTKTKLYNGWYALRGRDVETVLASCTALSHLKVQCTAGHHDVGIRSLQEAQAFKRRRLVGSSSTLSHIDFGRMDNLVELQLDCAFGSSASETIKGYLSLRNFPSLSALRLFYQRFHLREGTAPEVTLDDALLIQLDVLVINLDTWRQLPTPQLKQHRYKTLVSLSSYRQFSRLPFLDVFPPHLLVGVPDVSHPPPDRIGLAIKEVSDFLTSRPPPPLETMYLPPCICRPSTRPASTADLPFCTPFDDKIEIVETPEARGAPLLSHPFAKRCIAAKAKRAIEA